jgi:hypothetical protein
MRLVTLQVEVEVEYNSSHTIHQLVEYIQQEIKHNPNCIRPLSSKNIIQIESIANKKTVLNNQEG